jgi:hypothetical protein
MIELILCFAAAVIVFAAARRSLVAGLVALFAVGYVYGIARANFAGAASHFIFDAGVVGLYAARWSDVSRMVEGRDGRWLKLWVTLLVLWPVLLFLIPVQDPMIQIVGLRADIFFIPFILLGTRLDDEKIYTLAKALAILNIAAFLLAGAEYFLGVERFFPHNEVTQILYNSKDVANYTAYRIPSFFSSPAAYGGTMVMTLPLLLGAWIQRRQRMLRRIILATGIAASALGVLMCASRSHFLVMTLLFAAAAIRGRAPVALRAGVIAIVVLVCFVAAGNQRLQRFTELSDTDYLGERVATSVNMGFFEAAAHYPLGNGLGGGGTSIPYFLQDRLKDPVGIENEYARILLEEGLPGLFLWVGFLVWLFTRKIEPGQAFEYGKRLAWITCLAYFVTGLIGTGLLTSIPGTPILLLSISWAVLGKKLAEEKPATLPVPIANDYWLVKVGS